MHINLCTIWLTEYDLNGSVAFRANVLTFSEDDVLVFDDWTPVTYQNWLENDSEDKDGSVAVDPIFGLLLTYHHDDKWHWVPERNYTYYTGPEGLQLPFFCEDSSYIPDVGWTNDAESRTEINCFNIIYFLCKLWKWKNENCRFCLVEWIDERQRIILK